MPPKPPAPPDPKPPTKGFCPDTNPSPCASAVKGQQLSQCTAGYEHVELHVTPVAVTVSALFIDVAGCVALAGGCSGQGHRGVSPLNPMTAGGGNASASLRGVIYTHGGKEGGQVI